MFSNRINLDDIAIAAPCQVNWKDMTGDDKIRLCLKCNLNVYNVSEMTRKEAEEIISSHNGDRFCLKIYRRVDGTILTKDCPIGKKILDKSKRRIQLVIAACISLFNLSPALAKQLTGLVDRYGVIPEPTFRTNIERYGFGVNMPKEKFGPLLNSRLVNARIGEQGGAETDALAFFERALQFEQYGNSELALQSYAQAVDYFHQGKQIYDSKFTKVVGSKYAHLLRKTKNHKTAKKIESDFCKNKPIELSELSAMDRNIDRLEREMKP